MNEKENINTARAAMWMIPGINISFTRPIQNEFQALALAENLALFTECQSKRGVVIWSPITKTVLSIGINRQPVGFPCGGTDECKRSCGRTAIHAEESAIIHAKMDLSGASLLHVKSSAGGIIPSGRPSCVRCSGMILESGIETVWLYHADGLKSYTAKEFHRLSMEELYRRYYVPF